MPYFFWRPKPHRTGPMRWQLEWGCFGELGVRKSMSKNFQCKSFHWITIFEWQSFDNFVRFMASPQVAHFRILTKQQITHCSCYVFTLVYARSQHQTGIPVEAQESGYVYVPNSPWITQINKTVNFRCRPFWKKCVELHHVCESRCFTISWFFFHHVHYHHDQQQQQQHADLMKFHPTCTSWSAVAK